MKRYRNFKVILILLTAFFWNFSLCDGDSVTSLTNFNRAIIFRSFRLDFLSANSATPIISYQLFSNLRFAHRMIHPRNCRPALFPAGFNRLIIFKASSSSSRMQINFEFFWKREFGRLLRLLTCPEWDLDLLVLALRFAAPLGLSAPPAQAACQVGCATWAGA